MNIQNFLVVVVSLIFLIGCSPEIGMPKDFQRHLELVEKKKLIPKEEVVGWLGEPERVIEISNILYETRHFRCCKVIENNERAEMDAHFTMDSWYQRYKELNSIPIKDNQKWSSDNVFMTTRVWSYYFDKPLEVNIAYRSWIGATKRATLKKSLFFIQIDEDVLLAVPSLKRK